jgi:hypothetical protein
MLLFITSVGTLTNLTVSGTGSFTTFTDKYDRNVRNLGVITDATVVTVDFATDAIIVFEWDNGFTIDKAYKDAILQTIRHRESNHGKRN